MLVQSRPSETTGGCSHHAAAAAALDITLPQPPPAAHQPRQRSLSVSNTNALDHFRVLEDALSSGRSLVVLLDYDGTLTPIVNDPAKALLSNEMRDTLRALPNHFVTGIVTGRSLAKILNFVGVPGLIYAGSHGYDILAPVPGCPSKNGKDPCNDPHASARSSSNGQAAAGRGNGACSSTGAGAGGGDVCGGGLGGVRYQVAGEFLPSMQQIKSELEQAISSIPGAAVEDNIYSISVHYRNCPRNEVPHVREVVGHVQAAHRGIRLKHGKEVFELQPDVHWNKGCAVVWMLEMLGLSAAAANGNDTASTTSSSSTASTAENGSGVHATAATTSATEAPGIQPPHKRPSIDPSEIFTIFIGDDKSDEDAFQVFTGEGSGSVQQPGLGILVSEESRATHAALTLKNPGEVAELLSRLVSIGQSKRLRPVRVCTCTPQGQGGMGAGGADAAGIGAEVSTGGHCEAAGDCPCAAEHAASPDRAQCATPTWDTASYTSSDASAPHGTPS